jgi:hypothetical protein
MRNDRRVWKLGAVLAALAWTAVCAPRDAFPHCDGLDGPVVTAARQALDSHDVTRVLIWVQPADEPAIRKAFEKTVAVRKFGRQAAELADTWFFETLVRVHRAGEGAPFTGLQPAGRDLGPAIPAADLALESGDVEPLVRLVLRAAEEGVRHRFAEARAARSYPAGNVEAGRRYVAAYVPFVHYVEGLYAAAEAGPSGHGSEVEAVIPHHH